MTPVGRVFMANLPRLKSLPGELLGRFGQRLEDGNHSIQQQAHGCADRLRDVA
jgi:hypothetical protein